MKFLRQIFGGARQQRVFPVLPLINQVLFPGGKLPMKVERAASVLLLREVADGNRLFLLVSQRSEACHDPGGKDLFNVGTLAELTSMTASGGPGTANVEVIGLARWRITKFVQSSPFLLARASPCPDAPGDVDETRFAELRELARRLTPPHPYREELERLLPTLPDGAHLVDIVAANFGSSVHLKQRILESQTLDDRLTTLAGDLRARLAPR